ncbi:MAG: glycosyltransferase [Bacteroidales bacterium]
MKSNILFPVRVAILIASYNRKEKTMACLNSIKAQEISDNIHIEIFLTDDESSDGTVDQIKNSFPEVNIYNGNGSLFWAGGMRNSWGNALITDPDYYLLLNDDTFLFCDALKKILSISINYYNEKSNQAIFIGSTKDIKTDIISYGGRKLYSRNRPKGYLIQSNTDWVECDLGEANIMLVPRIIVQQIGILSNKFTHGIADYDYTLRAKKKGFKVMVAPGILGTCSFDHGKGWKSADTKLADRIKYLYSPKGLAYKEYLYYIKKHFPLHLPEAIFKLWLKTLFPIVYDRFK